MVLVDTSVWINHLKSKNEYLSNLLLDEKVLIHPFIIGELACGSMNNRDLILRYLDDMPRSTILEHEETLNFLNSKNLYSKGLGWIDVNLLLSAIYAKCKLWTLDQRLRTVAIGLKINYSPIKKN